MNRPDIPGPPPRLGARREWVVRTSDFTAALGISGLGSVYGGRVHGLAAFELYMQDRLEDSIAAFEQTVEIDFWGAPLLYVASAELEARDFATREEHDRLILELPAEHGGQGALRDAAVESRCAVEARFGLRCPATMVTFLPEGSLAELTESRHGYAVPKEPYQKVCIPTPTDQSIGDAQAGMLHEFAHVAVDVLTHSRAPYWLNEGLAQCVEADALDEALWAGEPLGPGEFPKLGRIDSLFEPGGPSEEERTDYAYAASYAAVARLMEVHGWERVVGFTARLAEESEGRAFRHAFGESRRQFERTWHEWLRDKLVEG